MLQKNSSSDKSTYRQVSAGVSEICVAAPDVVQRLQLFHSWSGDEYYVRQKLGAVVQDF